MVDHFIYFFVYKTVFSSGLGVFVSHWIDCFIVFSRLCSIVKCTVGGIEGWLFSSSGQIVKCTMGGIQGWFLSITEAKKSRGCLSNSRGRLKLFGAPLFAYSILYSSWGFLRCKTMYFIWILIGGRVPLGLHWHESTLTVESIYANRIKIYTSITRSEPDNINSSPNYLNLFKLTFEGTIL